MNEKVHDFVQDGGRRRSRSVDGSHRVRPADGHGKPLPRHGLGPNVVRGRVWAERPRGLVDAVGHQLVPLARSKVALRRNMPATGGPTISGTAQVGQTLTADTSGITDANGLTTVSYSYKWSSSDGTTCTAIPGATKATHEVQATD